MPNPAKTLVWMVKSFRAVACFGAFIFIVLVGCSPSPAPVPSANTSTVGLSYPIVDNNRLLTDAELQTLADPANPVEPPAVRAWIQQNHRVLRSLVVDKDFSDLQFFKSVLGNKRLVQLGESGHGVREFNMAKTRLIKFLHQEMGYDVIAFESGLFECYDADQRAAEFATPLQMMGASIFGVWSTVEVEELFRYIQTTKSSARPLLLAGFDSQRSAAFRDFRRPAFFRSLMSSIDATAAQQAFAHDSAFSARYAVAGQTSGGYQQFSRDLQNELQRWLTGYEAIAEFCERNRVRLGQTANNPIIPLFAAQCARSAAEFVKQIAATNGGGMIRDKAMAQNIDFLLKTMYPDKKIMVWAHNYHIRHANTQTLILPGLTPGINVHGEYLVELGRRNDMYTIGLLMYRGSAAANNRQVYAINSVTAGSIESIAYQARKHYLFFDMTSQVRSDSTVWMFEQRVAKEWGVNQLLGVWRNQYDGILFIDAVNPPVYR